MSTRSTISVKDAYDTFYIYRHCDGYPQGEYGVVNTLKEALPYAWTLPRFESMDFAAAIIRAWKDEGGGNIYFTRNHDFHADTEYQYYITFKDGKLQLKVKSGYGPKMKTIFNGSFDDALEKFKE